MEWIIIIVLVLLLFFILLREKKTSSAMIEKEAILLFEKWKEKEVPKIRKSAAQSSQAVTLGKSMEHIIPYFPEFQYNPKDVRFLGSPIDFVVFDGLSEGDLKEVVFIEVKTGKTAKLPTREKQVKECILERNVDWQLLHYKAN